ncbi:MAG TPA: 4-hydroxythreonine-4-phosphate dehydrogenase PdxA [Thermoanaerobaculia bacterium]|nr:4-hydroxythreonine-4-phosphate dehydrogenase PdxA [Thermoanaerobaculia bacterium]
MSPEPAEQAPADRKEAKRDSLPILAITQGDPAGIGPEILLRLVSEWRGGAGWVPLLVAERAALEAVRDCVPGAVWRRLSEVGSSVTRAALIGAGDAIPLLDPVARSREVVPGAPGRADAEGAMAAIDQALEVVRGGLGDAMVTAPIAKKPIAEMLIPGFRGHTDYLAERCGLERYGRDYLMAFLAGTLRVALVSAHLPLRTALDELSVDRIVEAGRCLAEHALGGGRLVVPGVNPHAGEGGLLGREDEEIVRPAVERLCALGVDAHGPASADSVFARARRGEYDWVLALYHDQGLIAVKTAAFGAATNWTVGLPILRTSVDHGTAPDLAGKGRADAGPMKAAVATTLELLERGRRGP